MAAEHKMAPMVKLLFGLTFLAEAIGIGLVIGDIHRAGKVLARGASEGLVSAQGMRVELLIRELLGKEARIFLARWLGIGLLSAGILLGTVANVLSIS